MADVRPFRGLRYDPARVDPALAVAPPYDVISPRQQAALYAASPHNVVRIEYGEQRPDDSPSDNRYTRAARDLAAWREAGVLVRDAAPALYAYRQQFGWAGRGHARHAVFAVIRLEEWEKGIIKPHEHTLSGPKQDRLDLLRATRTQVSPAYCLYRRKPGVSASLDLAGAPLCEFEADGQCHTLAAVTNPDAIRAFADLLADSDVYVADGHHRYETALNYRDEVRARAASWAGDEPENFVLMALTAADDPGLLVLPTHRIVHREPPPGTWNVLEHRFDVERFQPDDLAPALACLRAATPASTLIAAVAREAIRVLTLRDRAAVEGLMPADQPAAWKALDVNVLQYGVLAPAFGIDDAALAAGGAVSYTQDAAAATAAVVSGEAPVAFLLNPTPVEQVLAVADAGARMPQKSTYFYPKLLTGLVMNPLGL